MVLPAAFTFFHRAFVIADSLALVAPLIRRLAIRRLALPLILAQRRRASAAIRAFAARLILRMGIPGTPRHDDELAAVERLAMFRI